MSLFRILPATQTVAALQPHILTIELPTFAESDVKAAKGGGADTRPLELVAHELCHWFDIIGTVWGQSYLNDLFVALDHAIDATAGVAAYPSAIKLFDADRSILFPTYYKYVKPNALRDTGPGRWRMEITTGARVDTFGSTRETDPILFVHFSTQDGDIGRQPVSVGSLLELRAIFSELAAYRHISGQWAADEQTVGDALFSRRIIESMYDPELITYSAAAHYVGRVLNEGEIIQAFGLGSILADFALNLTPESFSRMRTAQQMAGWGPTRLNGFRANCDRGFAFGSLTFWAQIVPPGSSSIMKVATVLRASGLSTPDAIYGPAEEYVRGLRADHLRNPKLREIREKTLTAGREVIAFRRMGPPAINIADWANLPTPPILDREFKTFFAGRPTLSYSDIEFLHECDLLLNEVTRQALRAARGLDFRYTDWVY